MNEFGWHRFRVATQQVAPKRPFDDGRANFDTAEPADSSGAVSSERRLQVVPNLEPEPERERDEIIEC